MKILLLIIRARNRVMMGMTGGRRLCVWSLMWVNDCLPFTILIFMCLEESKPFDRDLIVSLRVNSSTQPSGSSCDCAPFLKRGVQGFEVGANIARNNPLLVSQTLLSLLMSYFIVSFEYRRHGHRPQRIILVFETVAFPYGIHNNYHR